MPKRPLSAYNIFFADERQRLLRSGDLGNANTVGFAGLARTVASRWKNVDAETKKKYQTKSEEERQRYLREVKHWETLMASSQQRKPTTDPLLSTASSDDVPPRSEVLPTSFGRTVSAAKSFTAPRSVNSSSNQVSLMNDTLYPRWKTVPPAHDAAPPFMDFEYVGFQEAYLPHPSINGPPMQPHLFSAAQEVERMYTRKQCDVNEGGFQQTPVRDSNVGTPRPLPPTACDAMIEPIEVGLRSSSCFSSNTEDLFRTLDRDELEYIISLASGPREKPK